MTPSSRSPLDSESRLGSSGIIVSRLSLGSWRTYEQIGFDHALEVIDRALELGITFFDDARYNDETGRAPLPTGYSEVLFGRLIAATGRPRAELVLANKLWWEHWPREDARAELSGSLERLKLDHVDLIYAVTPPADLPIEAVVEQVGGLLADGLARAWGVANWEAGDIARAAEAAALADVPAPVAAQLRYGLSDRSSVDRPMVDALRQAGAGLIPSSVLAGGLLSGKYARSQAGRMAAELENPVWRPAVDAAAELAKLTAELDASPAQLAIAFALDHPLTASVLFGVTSVTQLEDNVGALAVHARLDAQARARLNAIAGLPPGTATDS
jgi:aryl-alcohol dehydrogenase-like predicted oxidoreductase